MTPRIGVAENARMHTASSLLFVALSLSPSSGTTSTGTTDWPQFRGPNGTGAVPAAKVPLEWSETQHVAWKSALPGQGWSQPVIVGGTVYFTYIEAAKQVFCDVQRCSA